MFLDLAVVGGGPAGLIAAREAAERGLEVVVLEEHSTIGEPERCAGLLSLEGLTRLSMPSSAKYIQNVVRGVVIHVGARSFLIDAGRPVAAVVSRKIFDQELARRAEGAGACILTGIRVKEVERSGEGLILRGDGVRIRAGWVVDAEGAGAALLWRFLGRRTEGSRWIPIIQALVEGHGLDHRYAHIFLKDYLPDFFAYLVPVSRDLGRFGVASRYRDLRRCMERVIREEFPSIRVLHQIRYAIYTGRPLGCLDLSTHFIPVGDAAGHVKATTGGGVVMGGLYSRDVAAAISEIIKGGDPTPYLESASRILAELQRIFHLRSILWRIPRILHAPLLAIVCSRPIKDLLTYSWDMDFQVSSITSAICGAGSGLYRAQTHFSWNE